MNSFTVTVRFRLEIQSAMARSTSCKTDVVPSQSSRVTFCDSERTFGCHVEVPKDRVQR